MLKRMLILLVLVMMLVPVSAQEGGVSDARFERLAKGINLPFRFWYGSTDAATMEASITDSDLTLIQSLGLTNIRLPIDPNFLLDESAADKLNADHVAVLERVIDKIVGYGLAVTVDMHTTPDQFPGSLTSSIQNGEHSDVLLAFWAGLAKRLSSTDPEYVFLEPMNEPVYQNNAESWNSLQVELIATIRENAPEHTIIATSSSWSNRELLLKLTPLDDPNILYNFHFYEPFWFTHQGADWAGDDARILRDIPYPSSPDLVAPFLPAIKDERVRGYINYYGIERWNANKMDALLGGVAEWAAKNNVRVISNEFGVYRKFTARTDRIEWIHDVRVAMEAHGIGWAMWEWDSDFGLLARGGRTPQVDLAVAVALGLNIEGLNS